MSQAKGRSADDALQSLIYADARGLAKDRHATAFKLNAST